MSYVESKSLGKIWDYQSIPNSERVKKQEEISEMWKMESMGEEEVWYNALIRYCYDVCTFTSFHSYLVCFC